jgi:hypothetical protein
VRQIQRAGLAFALCGGLATSLVHADPNDYVRTPTVEYGEKEIDFKSGVQRNRDDTSESANAIGLGWGATAWWFTEVYAKYKREAGESSAFDAWEWESRFQLTETGKYPVDVGFLFEIERPDDRTEGYELTFGPMLQKEWDRIQGNFNLFLQKHARATAAFDTELHYQAQVKYRDSEKLEWGVQAFGDLGQWDDWSPTSAQEHKIGPALFGKFRTGARQAIRWNTALLLGATDSSPSATLRFQAEYEF